MARRTFDIFSRFVTTDESSAVIEKNEATWIAWGATVLKTVAGLAAVKKTYDLLIGTFRDGIQAAIAQEDAVTRLNSALANLGDGAESVSESLQQQAEALQATTVFGDEAIIQAQAFLATMGVTAEQLPLATQATVDLASALGISLESAARNVGRTVGGFAGELGEVIPELKDLSAEALQAGAGIELLADKFAGRAALNAQQFGGAVAQVSNALGDLSETIGETVTGGDELAESLGNLAQQLTSLNESASQQTQGIFDGLLATFVDLGGALITGANNLLGVRVGFDEANKGAAAFADSTKKATLSQAEFVDELKKEVDVLQDVADAEADLAKFREETLADLGLETQTQLNEALELQSIRLEVLREEYRKGEIDRAQFEEGQRQIRGEIEALNAVLDGNAVSVEEYKDRVRDAASVQGLLTESVDATVSSLDLHSSALRTNTFELERNNEAKRRDPDRDPLIQSSETIGGGTFVVTRSRDSTPTRIGTLIGGGWTVPSRQERFGA